MNETLTNYIYRIRAKGQVKNKTKQVWNETCLNVCLFFFIEYTYQ